MSLELDADLCLRLGNAADKMAEIAAQNARYASLITQPVLGYIIVDQITLDANGNGILFLKQNGPDQGHVWEIRGIRVCGQYVHTALTGATADVFVSASGPSSPDSATVDFTQLFGATAWRDEATSLPSIAFYGRGELMMNTQDNLYLVITGGNGNAGALITATATISDFQDGARMQGVGM